MKRNIVRAAKTPWGFGASALAISMVLGAPAAIAQESQTAADEEVVIVTGIRAALRSAIDTKRGSTVQIDQINAEDIADFPDTNLAESLQRLPGISLERDNGEGRTLTVRGLGSDFTTVQINGMDALSTSGPSAGNAQSGANRSRGFDFNTFASELFSSLQVQKTASASTDEGSLGATIGLNTGRPLDYEERRLALSVEGAHYELGGATSPRFAALVSDTFMDGTFGVLASVAYSERDSQVNKYDRNVGGFELHYRNSQHATSANSFATNNAVLNPNGTRVYGFARPVGFVGLNAQSSCPATGVQPVGCGSNPSAYAQFPETTIMPALATISSQDLSYERLGATLTLQWQPTNRTNIVFDGLYAEYLQDTVLHQLTPVGINRNLYNLTASTNPGALTQANRQALYPTCTANATTDCGGTTLVDFDGPGGQPAALVSENPNNLEPYDYYNWVQSPGYAAHPFGINGWQGLVGRPNMLLQDAHTVAINGRTYADYFVLDNVDWRNAADGGTGEVYFSQASVNLDHEFTDNFRVHGLYGQSRSQFKGRAFLVEFNSVDSDGYTYDERGGGDMPLYNVGFDATDPSNWNIVKGLSAIRSTARTVTTAFETGSLDFEYDLNPDVTFNFGVGRKVFDFSADVYNRGASDVLNPTEVELGVSVESLGHVVDFGDGLNIPSGSTTSWFAPSMPAFISAMGLDCMCVNQWGDWRIFNQNGSANTVTETSTSYYGELAWDSEIGGGRFFGNAGVRIAVTELDSSGFLQGVNRTASHSYEDYLPSLNVGYEFLPDMYVRYAQARVMSRPFLGNLTPGGSMSTSCTPATPGGVCATDPNISIGNPFLDPFRADNFDLAFEWYFAEDGLFSAAYFRKDIESFPQTVRGEGELSDALQGSILDEVVAALPTSLQDHVANGGQWVITQQRDSPGGYINGYELSFQTSLFFLPGHWSNFGVLANYTHLDSELEYVLSSASGVTGTAPYLDASPDAINMTLYYETDNWQARVSTSHRADYFQAFPLLSGTCDIGVTTNGGNQCASPLVPDFRGVKDSFRVDASFSYDFNDHMSFSLDAINLTDETSDRWAYQDVQHAQQHLASGRIFTVGFRLTN